MVLLVVRLVRLPLAWRSGVAVCGLLACCLPLGLSSGPGRDNFRDAGPRVCGSQSANSAKGTGLALFLVAYDTYLRIVVKVCTSAHDRITVSLGHVPD